MLLQIQQQNQQQIQQQVQHQQQQSLLQQNQRQNQQQNPQQQMQQEPTAAEINLMLSSLGLGLPPADSLQLANWDLKKLAMYLVSKMPLKSFIANDYFSHNPYYIETKTYSNLFLNKKKTNTFTHVHISAKRLPHFVYFLYFLKFRLKLKKN